MLMIGSFLLFQDDSSAQNKAAPPAKPAQAKVLLSFQRPGMGTLFTIRLWASPTDSDKAKAAAESAFTEIKRLNFIFSDYELDSELLRSNAWHSRSDALSSLVVIAGVAGSMAGYAYFDALAAIVVAIMILWVSVRMIWQGAADLIDTGVQPSRVTQIKAAIKEVPGVRDVHDLRTRRMGNEIFLDGHVLVEPKLSVSEGHRIAEAVRHRLRGHFPDITDITIHIDAEDDTAYQKSAHLPMREEANALIDEYWARIPEARLITRRTLHYLDGKLHVEAHLPLEAFSGIEQASDAARRLRQAVAGDPRIAEVEVLFE